MTPAAPLVLLPARRASTRLPDKLLLAEDGTPLIVHTCRQAAKAFGPASVVVCADDEALVAAVTAAGFTAQMTRRDHQSGTDRIAEVVAKLPATPGQVIVNVQGDEPELDPDHIRTVAGLLDRHPQAAMATLAAPGDKDTQANPNQVKVLVNQRGLAMTFTRAPCVFDRDAGRAVATCLRHLGIYAYRREVLLGYAQLPWSRWEQAEKLEQLRALDAGLSIAVATVAPSPPGIDVRADYDAFLARRRGTPPPPMPPARSMTI